MWENVRSALLFRAGGEDVSGFDPGIQAMGGDPRVVSRFAALCRRYSLDEIPQLYHIAPGADVFFVRAASYYAR